MKTVPPSLSSHLTSGATTLCRCWRVVRPDGSVFGFTNHDRPLVFAGTHFDPSAGFSASELQSSLGLAVDTMEVDGALSSERITDADIALGLWDAAEVEIFLVNWRDTEARIILRKGILGEVSRGELAYHAEIRSAAHQLNQERGRTYQRSCDVVLGSPRCGIDLTDLALAGGGTVVAAIDGRLIAASGLDGFDSGWFSFGVLTWTSGPNQGGRSEIRAHAVSSLDGAVGITLFQCAARDIAPGDTFTVTAGCDRTFEMCRDRFSNALNFQGFPHIPGDDFALGYARRDKVNDGGSFFHD